MRALIYLRVSSEGQARKENPISTQKNACLEFARRNGYDVDEAQDIYIDAGISGRSTKSRIAYQAIMERMKTDKNVVGIVAYDTSRISRNLMVYLQFKEQLNKYGKKFFSITEPHFNDDNPVSKLMENMLASFAEFRSGQDGEKISAAMKQKAESGLYVGLAPYGYKNVRGQDYGGKEKRWIETNPITAPIVKEIFAMYTTGRYSLQQVADELNRKGYATSNKKPWVTSSVEKILKNKAYIGHIIWGGVTNPHGQHEKFVDEETFYKVQALMRARNFGANKMRKHTFILRGFSSCGECGSRITGAYHTKPNGMKYSYYQCQRRQHAKPVSCKQSVVAIEELEKQLLKLIKTIQIPHSTALRLEEKIKQVVQKDKGPTDDMRKSLVIQLENIAGKKKSSLEKYVEGNISDDAYRTFKLDLEARELQLKAQLEKVDDTISGIVAQIETAIGLARNCYKTYKTASYEQKILLAQTFFEKVIIKDRTIQNAFLNHPFAYICQEKAKAKREFQYQYTGGNGGS
ncbi:MAG: recombinase family protein [Patescibacteria group bacterium]|nr:recombinase family protein [Patescibacteria group bacterium]MDE2438212.1 recombinase family protein [Patescibacteria group bacterium]